MSEIAPPEMADLELAHTVLTDVFRDYAEPMPDWDQGDQVALETCCGSTEVAVFGQAKYPALPQKAAKLFYDGVKLHAFPNGNKRFGVMITLLFLLKNGHMIVAKRESLRRWRSTWPKPIPTATGRGRIRSLNA